MFSTDNRFAISVLMLPLLQNLPLLHQIQKGSNLFSLLQLSSVPTAVSLNLNDLKFDDFRFLDDQMLTAAVRMFMEFDFLKTYQIKYEVGSYLCFLYILD